MCTGGMGARPVEAPGRRMIRAQAHAIDARFARRAPRPRPMVTRSRPTTRARATSRTPDDPRTRCDAAGPAL